LENRHAEPEPLPLNVPFRFTLVAPFVTTAFGNCATGSVPDRLLAVAVTKNRKHLNLYGSTAFLILGFLHRPEFRNSPWITKSTRYGVAVLSFGEKDLTK
jgi:hypothetical protein